MKVMKLFRWVCVLMSCACSIAWPADVLSASASNLLSGDFKWITTAPVVSPANRPADPCVSVKDPSVVRFNGRWHLFCTIRSKVRTHQIEYLSFADWKDANSAERHVLTCCDGYFCAPQVFRYSRNGKWYMVYQAPNETKTEIQPVYSTTTKIEDPGSWSKPQPFYPTKPANVKAWIDFWVIADAAKAHLFFTSLDGRFWRAETKLSDFPFGWTEPKVVLQADIFEAAHVYRLKGLDEYLALIEAQAGGRRYYKAYIADALDGTWKGLADTREKPFASPLNVRQPAGHWTDSFSHGELLRDGCDEQYAVDPRRLQFLFQGVSDQRKEGKSYGEIPWRLGILEQSE